MSEEFWGAGWDKQWFKGTQELRDLELKYCVSFHGNIF